MNAHLLKTFVSSAFVTLILAQTLAGMPVAGAPAQPAGMPSATPAMPSAQDQPQQQTMPAATPTPPPQPPSATQLKEVQEALTGIEEAKTALTKLLTDLDAKLLEARKQAAEAKTLSFGILEKQQESEAKADYEKIRAANKSVQDAQQFAQTEFTKNFNDKIAEIRVKSTQADAALKAVNAQKAAAAAAKQQAAAKSAQNAATVPAPAPAPTPTATNQSREREAAPSGIADSISSGIASAFSGIKGLFGSDPAAKKKTVIVQNLPPVPTDATQRAKEAAEMVQQMDKGLQSLDATRGTIQQYLATINQSSKYIESLAKQSEEGARLLTQSKKDALKPADSGWKKTTLYYTGKVLDGIGYMASNIYDLFDATIGAFTRRIVKDVKRKIATQESSATPATA